MSTNEKSAVVTTPDVDSPMNANVMTITRPVATRQHPNNAIDILSTIEDCESTRSMSIAPSIQNEKSVVEVESSPYSFLQKSESKENMTGSNSGFDTDIEGLTQMKTEAACSRSGLVAMKAKCSTANAWPSRTEQKKMMKTKKQNRAFCGCWAGMTRKHRNMIKVGILLVVLGLIIGLCVGVTRAVHGGVFHPN